MRNPREAYTATIGTGCEKLMTKPDDTSRKEMASNRRWFILLFGGLIVGYLIFIVYQWMTLPDFTLP
jgi:hypothetical protein